MLDTQNIASVAQLRPNYLGFIFYPKSVRYVGNHLSSKALQQLPKSIQKVGIFVNASSAVISQAVQSYHLNLVQLHGNESPEFCQQLKVAIPALKIIKVFRLGAIDFDFTQLKPFETHIDFFLFDTKGKQYGGNGTAFNWDILAQYPSKTPFFLSGGIGANDAQKVQQWQQKHPHLPLYALDLNSKFETKPALKDYPKLSHFIEALKVNIR